MSKQKLPIIIVGGGIGGMTAALALAKKQLFSIVLEQAPQFREAGVGIQFCPNTFKVLDYLGLSKPFTDIAIFPDNLCYRDGLSGLEFVRLPLGQQIVDRFSHPFGSFRRDDVLHTFVEQCRQSPFITLITTAKVIEVQEIDHKVLAKTASGETYEGEALIGCDGIWSVVRKFVIGNDEPRVSGQIIYRGLVPHEKMPQHLDLENIVHYVRPHAHLVHYPIGNHGDYNISAIFQSERMPDPHEYKGNREELFSWFEGSRPEVMDILERVDTSRMWALCDRNPIAEWSKGRMAMLGDAIHATLPYLTSGAGMAVEDAFVLAKYIHAMDRDYPSAFKAYQKERYLRTAYVQLLSRAYGDVHHSSGVARELRNEMISKRSVEENYQWVSYLYSGIEIN